MKIFKKEREVRKLALDYLDVVETCAETARAAVVAHINADHATMADLYPKVSADESKADELRRSIADTLYSGAYLPLMRADICNIIDALDSVPNAAEACCGFYYCEKPVIPEEFKEAFLQITNDSFAIVTALSKAVRSFFNPKKKIGTIREHVKAVGVQESAIDALESELAVKIFETTLDLAQKMHLKRALDRITHIPDRSEDAAEMLEVVAMKAIQ